MLRALQVLLMFPLRCGTQTTLASTMLEPTQIASTMLEIRQTMIASTMLDATVVEEPIELPKKADPRFAHMARETVLKLLSEQDVTGVVKLLLKLLTKENYQKEYNKIRCQQRRRRHNRADASAAPVGSLASAQAHSPLSPLSPLPGSFSPGV